MNLPPDNERGGRREDNEHERKAAHGAAGEKPELGGVTERASTNPSEASERSPRARGSESDTSSSSRLLADQAEESAPLGGLHADAARFAEEVLGIPLTPYQRELVRAKAPRGVVLLGHRAGTSFQGATSVVRSLRGQPSPYSDAADSGDRVLLNDARIAGLSERAGGHCIVARATRDEERAMAIEIQRLRADNLVLRGAVEQSVVLYEELRSNAIIDDEAQGENFWEGHRDSALHALGKLQVAHDTVDAAIGKVRS